MYVNSEIVCYRICDIICCVGNNEKSVSCCVKSIFLVFCEKNFYSDVFFIFLCK